MRRPSALVTTLMGTLVFALPVSAFAGLALIGLGVSLIRTARD